MHNLSNSRSGQALYVEQIYLGCLSQASYLVCDLSTAVAAVIDPRRDTDVYLEAAARVGVQIKHIFLTHIHADFVAGHLELQERTGARVYMGRQAAVTFPYTAVGEGDKIDFGEVALSIMETPGHTPESICIVAAERARNFLPESVFTGDTLFVGDVGRPDLLLAKGLEKEDLASSLYDSLQRLMALPDETVVYPGHGAGSLCGKQLSSETVSTIGRQRRFNQALKSASRAEFVTALCASLEEPPAYFFHDAELNAREHSLLEKELALAMRPLSLEQLIAERDLGAQLVDVRMGDQFAEGHIDHAINVSLSGRFASFAGLVLDLRQPTYVLCEPGQESEAIMRLARIGVGVSGFYNYPEWLQEKQLSRYIRRYARLTADDLESRLRSDKETVVLDVRNPDEWQQKRIPGSLNLPLPRLAKEGVALPPETNFVVHCQSGYRSSIAVSLLLNFGHRNVSELIGGISECAYLEQSFLSV